MESVPQDVARALAVGAHPDDAEFFAGGTLAALRASGCETHLLVCTNGSRGGADVAGLPERRRREQACAAEALGLASWSIHDAEDGALRSDAALERALVEAIRRVRPEVVLGHDPRTLFTRVDDRVHPGHSDHRAAGQGLLDAVYPRAASPAFHPELGPAPWCPREIWLFDTGEPDRRLDVAASWETKLAALRAHESQEAVAGGLVAAAEALARHWSGGEGRAEAFVRLRIW